MITRLSFALTLVLTSGLSQDAWAQNAESAKAPAAAAPAAPAPLSESLSGMARAEYEAGKMLFGDGDFAGAAMKFERAYEESKDPRLLWNVAVAEKNLRHYVRVYAFAERYLSEAGSKLSESDRADAQALLETVKGFIADLTITVDQPGARVLVDDQLVGVTPLSGPVQLEMGDHKVSLQKPGFSPFNDSLSVTGGSAARLEVRLIPEIHQGRLRVVANPGDQIQIDGRTVGNGQWEGQLASGIHTVQVNAPDKLPYQSDVGVQDSQLASVRVSLESRPSPIMASESKGLGVLPWVLGGVAVAGLGVGAYFLFRPSDPGREAPLDGSLDPGSIPLGLRFQ